MLLYSLFDSVFHWKPGIRLASPISVQTVNVWSTYIISLVKLQQIGVNGSPLFRLRCWYFLHENKLLIIHVE